MKRGALIELDTQYKRAKQDEERIKRQQRNAYTKYIATMFRYKGQARHELTAQYNARVNDTPVTLTDISWHASFRAGTDGLLYIYTRPENPHKLLYADSNGVEHAWPMDDETMWPYTATKCVMNFDHWTNALLQYMLTFLKPVDMLRLARVNKRWYEILRHDNTWAYWKRHTLMYMPCLQPLFDDFPARKRTSKRGKKLNASSSTYAVDRHQSRAKTKSWITPKGTWYVFAHLLIQRPESGQYSYHDHIHRTMLSRPFRFQKYRAILLEAMCRMAITCHPGAVERVHMCKQPGDQCFDNTRPVYRSDRIHVCIHLTPYDGMPHTHVVIYVRANSKKLVWSFSHNAVRRHGSAYNLTNNFERIVMGRKPLIMPTIGKFKEELRFVGNYWARLPF